MNKSTIVVSCGSHVTKRSLQFIHKDFTLKEKTYHLNLLKDLISWMVYRPRAKFISGPGNISQVFSPSENCFQVLPSISGRYRPSQLSLLARFLFHLCPPLVSWRGDLYSCPGLLKKEKVEEKVFGPRPLANIAHFEPLPLLFSSSFLFYLPSALIFSLSSSLIVG